jgi:hypothetical protein
MIVLTVVDEKGYEQHHAAAPSCGAYDGVRRTGPINSAVRL